MVGGDDRRRRAGRAHHRGVRGAGHRLPGHGALRRAGPPAPARSRSSARARCTTAAARSRSTSARRRTPRRCPSWRSPPARAARVREVPITAAVPLRTVRGTLAELAELDPARRGCGCTCGSRPGPACARRCRSCCPGRWRSASTRSCCPTAGQRRPHRPARRPLAPASCSPTTWTAGGTPTTGVGELFDELLRGGRATDATAAAGPARLHRLPRTDHCGLHRRRLLRPGRADRLGQVHRARRDLLRPLRHGAALGRPAGIATRSPRRRPRPGSGWSSRRPAPGSWPPGWSAATARARSPPPTPGWSSCRPASTCPAGHRARARTTWARCWPARRPRWRRRCWTAVGLPYEQFTSCVVLPQGEFAEFLHAKPAERQQILVNLLGLHVYERRASGPTGRAGAGRGRSWRRSTRAARRAHRRRRRGAGRRAAAQVDAEPRARRRRRAAVPALAEAAAAAAREAAAELAELDAELAALAGGAAPAGVAEVGRRGRAPRGPRPTRRPTAVPRPRSARRSCAASWPAAGDQTALRRLLDAHAERDRLAAEADDGPARRWPRREASTTRRSAALGRGPGGGRAGRAPRWRRRPGDEAAQTADRAGTLRAHLVAGEPCPVCEQPVPRCRRCRPSSAVAAATARRQGRAGRDRGRQRAVRRAGRGGARAGPGAGRGAAPSTTSCAARLAELDAAARRRAAADGAARRTGAIAARRGSALDEAGGAVRAAREAARRARAAPDARRGAAARRLAGLRPGPRRAGPARPAAGRPRRPGRRLAALAGWAGPRRPTGGAGRPGRGGRRGGRGRGARPSAVAAARRAASPPPGCRVRPTTRPHRQAAVAAVERADGRPRAACWSAREQAERAARAAGRPRAGGPGGQGARPAPAGRQVRALAAGRGARRAGRRRLADPARAVRRAVRPGPRQGRVLRRRPPRRRAAPRRAHAVRRGDVPGVAGPGAGAVRAARRVVDRGGQPGVDHAGRGLRHAGRGHPGHGRRHAGEPGRPGRPDGRRGHPRAGAGRTDPGPVRGEPGRPRPPTSSGRWREDRACERRSRTADDW